MIKYRFYELCFTSGNYLFIFKARDNKWFVDIMYIYMLVINTINTILNAMESKKQVDQEEHKQVKKNNSNSTIQVFLIGFMIGIIIYSIVENSWGFFTLIPLFIIYKLSKNKEN